MKWITKIKERNYYFARKLAAVFLPENFIKSEKLKKSRNNNAISYYVNSNTTKLLQQTFKKYLLCNEFQI